MLLLALAAPLAAPPTLKRLSGKTPPKTLDLEETRPQRPGQPPDAADPDQQTRFVRLSRDQRRQPVALESAIRSYVPEDRGRTSPRVDLIAAVHVADKAYYDELNRLFGSYEVVLYELVAPEGTRIPQGARPASKHPITLMQTAMTRVLNLDFQLERIDYTRKNLVHADLSPRELAKAMEKRGENFWTILMRMMGYAMARQGLQDDPSDVRFLLALLGKNRSLALKRLVAEQFQDMEQTLAALEGPKGSALITDRNKAALGVLRKQIASGKKKLAIFYGAGHMADFDRQLRQQFGLVPVQTRWLVAWDLRGESKDGAAGPR